MSPCSPQPKQCHVSRSGVTMNDGVFSPWKGQRPFETLPARLSWTVSPTISSSGSLDLMSATMPDEVVAIAQCPQRRDALVNSLRSPTGFILPLVKWQAKPRGYLSRVSVPAIAACAAARRATGTLNGEQLT